MASMVEKQKRGRIERLESLSKRALAWVLASFGVLSNRVQQSAASGTVVAAGGAITPVAALTTKGPNGKIRVSAAYSGALPAGTFTPVLSVQVGGGPVTTEVNWAVKTGGAGLTAEGATTFELTTGAAPGSVITVAFHSTAGDGALTLGNAAAPAPIAASLLVEEVL